MNLLPKAPTLSARSKNHPPRRLWCIVLGGILVIVISMGLYRFAEEKFAPPYTAASMPLYREVVGTGQRKLVLIHGYLGSSRYWASRLSGMDRDHQVLMIDLLGFGRSPKPDTDYSLTMHVEAVRQAMREEGFLSPGTILVGHSLGAVIALALLAEEPDPTIGATLIALPVYKTPEEARRSLSNISPMHQAMVNNSSVMHLLCAFMDIFRIPLFVTAFDVPSDVYHDSLSHTWTSSSRTLQSVILKNDVNKIARQAAASHYLLFLQGAEDQVAPYTNSRTLAESLPNARFETLKAFDHQGFLKDPDKVWRPVRIFEELSWPVK